MLDDILLAASNLSRRFGGLTAVDRVSLTLVRGEVHAVIGTNGAGKSTLVNVLAGELPPSSGRVHLHGPRRHALVAAAARARRHRPQLPAHDDLSRARRCSRTAG